MSAVESGSTRRLDIGQALQDVLNLFQRRPGPVILLGVLLSGVPLSLLRWSSILAAQNPAYALVSLVAAIAFIICRPILFCSLIFLAAREMDGQPVTFKESLAGGGRRWGTMLGLTIWSGLLIGLGLIFLIAPGVFLAVQWAVAGPAVVLSGRGIADSMDVSARLTKGCRWSIFGFYLIVAVGFVVVSLALTFGAGLLSLLGWKLLANVFSRVVSSVLFDILVPTIAAVLYRRLRGDMGSGPTEALAEVFA